MTEILSRVSIEKIGKELGVTASQVIAIMNMLDEGATIPFIARYRKEKTGSLDEVVISDIRDSIHRERELEKRREAVLKSIEKQEKLTPELEELIKKATTLVELEDIYLPYKPKRQTKATKARELGLEPLAEIILEQTESDPEQLAEKYVLENEGVDSVDSALQGARDIIAEKITEEKDAREKVRSLFFNQAILTCKVLKGKEQEGIKYKDYFEYEERIKDIPSHRLLAIRRGESELFLSVDISPDESEAIDIIERLFIKSNNASSEQVKVAIKDGYKRLLKPSLETEVRIESKLKADKEAINVFTDNINELLLAPPLGAKNILAIDPGFRTGCKVVCLSKEGKLLHYETIFPNEPQRQLSQSGVVITALCKEFNIEAIAIGNGTASRETEDFVKGLNLGDTVRVVMVNESGASIYSASEIAREEFPNHDITVRGAVSIGRRLMDPLAELVKIDPKSIGVGQYQHDVDQNLLKSGLDDVVSRCVNQVGVELNTASKELLSYVSGLGPVLAGHIVSYRNENGAFHSREDLKKVPRMGEKAFEQAAGFLRIRNAANKLDSSAVHPESYPIVKKMASNMKCEVSDLMSSQDLRKKIRLDDYITEETGLPTLKDIMAELEKPGRDPRSSFEFFSFADGVNSINDVKQGMVLPGIITNVTKFGAFVDIGVHQDGLVHISQLSDNYVKDPNEVVKVNQKVTATVLEVDFIRNRISLSLKSDFSKKPVPKKKNQQKIEESDLASKLLEFKKKYSNE